MDVAKDQMIASAIRVLRGMTVVTFPFALTTATGTGLVRWVAAASVTQIGLVTDAIDRPAKIYKDVQVNVTPSLLT